MSPLTLPVGTPGAARRRLGALALSIAAGTALTIGAARSAQAGPWLPAAGSGDVEALVLRDSGDRSFPANAFSTATSPSASEHATQVRFIGEQGLGRRFSLDYDLRYGWLDRSRVRHGVTVVETSQGLMDQRIGLNYALTQDARFADAIGLGIVAPGSSGAKVPRLDSGQWAVEPIYRLGFKPGLWRLTGTFDIAPRVFVDGGVTQFRTHLEISAPITSRLKLAGKLFAVRSIRMNSYNDLRDHGELYDLVRVGAELKYRLTDRIEPVLEYDAGVAGMRGHAMRRIGLGVKISY